MRLTDLLDPGTNAAGETPEIAGITADSRIVGPGYLFAALPGLSVDGRDYIDEAIARGAVAVLAPPETTLTAEAAERGIRLVTDDNPRRRLSLMAARFYGAQPRVTAAVTGTNGKTSVAWFARQIWAALGHRAASMGTLGITAPSVSPSVSQGVSVAGSLTTADPVALHRTLAELAAAGIDHLVLEASSHGLEQFRLDGVAFIAGAFTNLSRDHLDYHRTMEAYRAAKLRLFSHLLPPGAGAVLNADSPDYGAFEAICAERGCPVIGYGARAGDIRIAKQAPLADGQDLEIEVLGRRHRVRLPLPGAFQAANALCALGLAIACGADAAAATKALPGLQAVPGRLQLAARAANGAPLYVDYAHTPDALENVLRALRPHTLGRLIVVFGCGGDRDPGKRPMMGAIAADLADIAIVTDDTPRGEDPAEIRRQILAGCAGGREAGDRAEAIHAAAAELQPGDVLVIAGKGHETGQIVGDQVRPFDDAEIARQAVPDAAGRDA